MECPLLKTHQAKYLVRKWLSSGQLGQQYPRRDAQHVVGVSAFDAVTLFQQREPFKLDKDQQRPVYSLCADVQQVRQRFPAWPDVPSIQFRIAEHGVCKSVLGECEGCAVFNQVLMPLEFERLRLWWRVLATSPGVINRDDVVLRCGLCLLPHKVPFPVRTPAGQKKLPGACTPADKGPDTGPLIKSGTGARFNRH